MPILMEETGEQGERELNHSEGEAERLYRDWHARGIRVPLGKEATGFSRWFERLLAELDFELGIGDLAQIKAKSNEETKGRTRGWPTLTPIDAGK